MVAAFGAQPQNFGDLFRVVREGASSALGIDSADLDFNNFDASRLAPLLQIGRDELSRFEQMASLNRRFIQVLDSGAFTNTTFTTIKNIPALLGLESGIAARLRYLEAAVMAGASLVHNFVMAIIFTIAAGVTFGQIDEVNDYFKRQWLHTALALGSMVTGFIGTIVPLGGAISNVVVIGGAVIFAGPSIRETDAQMVALIKDIYARNRDGLVNATRTLVNNNDLIFDTVFGPAFTHINQNIEGVTNMFEMASLIKTTFTRTQERVEGMVRGLQGLQGMNQMPEPNNPAGGNPDLAEMLQGFFNQNQ